MQAIPGARTTCAGSYEFNSVQLAHECPGWTTEAVPLFLVAPSRRPFTPLVRALRDLVAGRLQALMARAPR